MSDKPKQLDRPQAFPLPSFRDPEDGEYQHGYIGMELRDYFAAKAMQGMFANPYWDEHHLRNISEQAYDAADCMLDARAKAEGGAS